METVSIGIIAAITTGLLEIFKPLFPHKEGEVSPWIKPLAMVFSIFVAWIFLDKDPETGAILSDKMRIFQGILCGLSSLGLYSFAVKPVKSVLNIKTITPLSLMIIILIMLISLLAGCTYTHYNSPDKENFTFISFKKHDIQYKEIPATGEVSFSYSSDPDPMLKMIREVSDQAFKYGMSAAGGAAGVPVPGLVQITRDGSTDCNR